MRIEETFPAVAAKKLGRSYYNLCVPGTDLGNLLQTAQTYLVPDSKESIVVVSVNFENDVLTIGSSMTFPKPLVVHYTRGATY